VDVDRAAELRPETGRRPQGDLRDRRGITFGALFEDQKVFDVVVGVDRSCATTSMMCGI